MSCNLREKKADNMKLTELTTKQLVALAVQKGVTKTVSEAMGMDRKLLIKKMGDTPDITKPVQA